MNEHEDRILRETGLAFFATIMAGQTHEVTNVLNIIGQLAGLQEDLLSGEDPDVARNGRRLGQLAARIRGQVERGEAILRNMNRFAHSADLPLAVCDLKELLERTVSLAQRSARLANTVLEERHPETSVQLETNPFLLELAIFRCIQAALSAASQDRRIIVSYRVSGEEAEVGVTSTDPIPSGPKLKEDECALDILMRELGGAARVSSGAGPDQFTLLVPCPGGASP